MANQKDRLRQNVRGGGLLKIRQLISGSGSTTWLDVGYLESDKLSDTPNMVEEIDETGDMINVLVGATKVEWDAVLMQAGIDEINLLRQAVGNYYELYYYVKLANGNIQEYNAPICVITPKLDLTFAAATKRNIPLKITFLRPKAQYTRNPTDYNNNTNTPPDYYVAIENAAAKNAPVDTVGTVYTSVM